MRKILYLLLVIFLISGCSTAGPFVTNVSTDGRGNLIIEKQTLVHDGFAGIISTKDLTTSTIQIIPEEKE